MMDHYLNLKQQRNASITLALLMCFRMLGLFMILPVFALYAEHLPHSSAFTIGMALGIYGFTQAMLQIPFGMLSDRFGRKPLIAIGLVLFALGSIVAALSHGIYGIILGRALQGTGAVGSVIIATVADLTHESQRTKSMAIVGLSIGASFLIALILGPILNSWVGVSGIFWLTSLLAALGLVLLFYRVPTPVKQQYNGNAQTIPNQLFKVLKKRELLRLDFGIFSLHAILTASFLIVPLMLEKIAHVPEKHQWLVYLPVLILAFITMIPFVIVAEKRHKMKPIFLGAILFIGISQCLLSFFHSSAALISLCLFIFFTAFTLLESTLPSLISKLAPKENKGTAMGIYSTCQFLGIFFGGTMGGLLLGHYGFMGILTFCALLAFLWLGIAARMQAPKPKGTPQRDLPIESTKLTN